MDKNIVSQVWNAQSAEDMWKAYQEEKELPKRQTAELEKHTSILNDVSKLTEINLKVSQELNKNTQTLVKCTEENQKSSKRQFWASIIVAIVAVIIALFK